MFWSIAGELLLLPAAALACAMLWAGRAYYDLGKFVVVALYRRIRK